MIVASGSCRDTRRATDRGTIKADDITSEQYNLLLTIPGVGPQLASYSIALTDGFHRFTNPRELACHAGVAPFERSSGSSIRGRTQVSHQANKILKTMLHGCTCQRNARRRIKGLLPTQSI
ncbi:MAG: IS110 family transposase [Flavobacteriales bacterium]|nr:IS110 family transposase [Flavobacteriales bacterium]